MRYLAVVALLPGIAAAQSTGVPPRVTAGDYPVHAAMPTATLAAQIVPPDQVRKMFSNDVARQYVVVEVAVYPDRAFDVDRFYFSLKTGDNVSHAARPRDAALPWPEKKGPLGNRGPSVTTETGVIYERVRDPDRDPRPPADPDVLSHVEQSLQDRELPMGPARKPVAGYLYFPVYAKKHKGDAVELQYSRDDDTATLRFPAK